jgi:hypothetical protein
MHDLEIEVAVRHRPIEEENREGGAHFRIGGGGGT